MVAAKATPILLAACEEALDVMLRTDAEVEQVRPCSEQEWQHPLAALRTAIDLAKVPA